MKKHTIRFRVDDLFLLMMLDKMELAGISSYSEFLRTSIQRLSIKEHCKQLNSIKFELNKIGININQIAKNSNKSKNQEEIVDELLKINEFLSQLLIRVDKHAS